jgi:hypothetical protein
MPICGKCKGIASLLELQGACIAGVATICGERKDDPKEVATWVPNKASRGGCWLLPLHPCNALDISRTLHLTYFLLKWTTLGTTQRINSKAVVVHLKLTAWFVQVYQTDPSYLGSSNQLIWTWNMTLV